MILRGTIYPLLILSRANTFIDIITFQVTLGDDAVSYAQWLDRLNRQSNNKSARDIAALEWEHDETTNKLKDSEFKNKLLMAENAELLEKIASYQRIIETIQSGFHSKKPTKKRGTNG